MLVQRDLSLSHQRNKHGVIEMIIENQTERNICNYVRGEVYALNIDIIQIDSASQPRKYFDGDEMDALKKSIADNGLICPVLFRVDVSHNLFLISGERRFRACLSLGKETIQGIFMDAEKYDEIALIENIQRSGLHPIDEAEYVLSLKDKYIYSQEQIGDLIGKAHNTVCDILTISKLADNIKEDARYRKELSRSALLRVARKKKPAVQQAAYDALLKSLVKAKGVKRPRTSPFKKNLSAAENALKCIRTIDLKFIWEDKDPVVAKLRELMDEIRNRIGTTVS